MKKILVVLLVGLMALSFAACGEETDTDNKSSGTTTLSSGSSDVDKETESVKNNDSGEITLEAVLNHATAPESDFEFSKDGEGNSGVLGYIGSDSIIVIPEICEGLPITKVEMYAFSNKDSEKAIKFADSIITIDGISCTSNTGLQIVVMGKETKYIGEGAFQGCSSLKEVSLNDGLETISSLAFAMCDNLKSITIPSSVTTIESGAFMGIEKELTIYGTAGSAAEKFAKEAGIEFVAQ